MIKKLWIFTAMFVAILGFSAVSADAQDRGQDEEVRYEVRFGKGKSSFVTKKQITLGTSHVYTLRANEGQDMKVILITGKKTSFTIYSPTEGIIEGADGETRWRGLLNESGEYQITVGTDKTANYTLEIFIK